MPWLEQHACKRLDNGIRINTGRDGLIHESDVAVHINSHLFDHRQQVQLRVGKTSPVFSTADTRHYDKRIGISSTPFAEASLSDSVHCVNQPPT